jgi:ribose-phosphate pyrophosphokinase
MFARYIRAKGLRNAIVVSPDLGGAKDARNFAVEVDLPLALIEKRRSPDGSSTEVMNLIGEVQGRDVLIIDEEIDTAGTIVNAARFVQSHGARRLYALATHAIFSTPALERLREAPFEEIIVTNTVAIPAERMLPNITVLDVGPLLGEVIQRIHFGQSVGEIFDE